MQRKKTTVVGSNQNKHIDFATMQAAKSFIVQSPMEQPTLRYIPDRDLVQRLIIRASNMKDDLGEFDMTEEHKGEAKDPADGDGEALGDHGEEEAEEHEDDDYEEEELHV